MKNEPINHKEKKQNYKNSMKERKKIIKTENIDGVIIIIVIIYLYLFRNNRKKIDVTSPVQ